MTSLFLFLSGLSRSQLINAFSSPDAIRNLLPPAGGTAVDGSFIKLEQSGTYQIKALSTSVTMAVLKLSNYHPTNAVLICDNTPQKEALSVGWSVGWSGNARRTYSPTWPCSLIRHEMGL